MIAVPLALFLTGITAEAVTATLLEVATLDATTWESISALDIETRQAALLAAAHPSLLVRVDRLQQQSSERFRRLLASRSKVQQVAAWELSRYHGLASRMLEADSSPALHEVVANFPQEIRGTALSLRSDRQLVESMARLNRATDIAFAALLAAEPEPVRSAFQHLVRIPDAMQILTADLSATVILAKAYDTDPEAVIGQLNLLRDEAAWAEVEAGDGGSAVPFADVAAAYRARYTYEPPAATRNVHVTRYYTAPQPYWYGFPLWYRGPRWGGTIGWCVVPGVLLIGGLSSADPASCPSHLVPLQKPVDSTSQMTSIDTLYA
jgi:hypothetical protein